MHFQVEQPDFDVVAFGDGGQRRVDLFGHVEQREAVVDILEGTFGGLYESVHARGCGVMPVDFGVGAAREQKQEGDASNEKSPSSTQMHCRILARDFNRPSRNCRLVIPASAWWAGELGAEVRVTDFPSASTAMSIVDLGPSDDPVLLLADAVALSATADRSGSPWSLVSFDLRLEDQDTTAGFGHVDREEPLATSSSAGSEERDWRISVAYAVRPADLPQLDHRISSDFASVRVDREAVLVTSESHSGSAEVWRTLIDVDRNCRQVAESAGIPVRLLEWRITDDGIDERVLWA